MDCIVGKQRKQYVMVFWLGVKCKNTDGHNDESVKQ